MLFNKNQGTNLILVAIAAVIVAGCSGDDDAIVGGWTGAVQSDTVHMCFWDDGFAGSGDTEYREPRFTWSDGVLTDVDPDPNFPNCASTFQLLDDNRLEFVMGDGCNDAGTLITFERNPSLDCERGQ